MKVNTLLLLSIAAITACSSPIQNRNVALHRAAVASSATDYNLTAQLATDGIIETAAPASMRFWLNGEPVPREEADWLLDERDKSKFTCELNSFELELKCNGCTVSTDAVCYYATFLCKNTIAFAPYSYVMQAKDVKGEWKEIGRWEGTLSEKEVAAGAGTINLYAPVPAGQYAGFKLIASCQTASQFTFNEWKFFRNGKQIEVRPSSVFSSYWVSRSGRDEWLQIDLGEKSVLSSASLYWNNPPLSGKVLSSDDGVRWKTAGEISKQHNFLEDNAPDIIKLRGRARYVRFVLDRTEDLNPFSLSEVEIKGFNDLKARESDWQLVRAGEKNNPEAWMPATVPGTVLRSYLENGAVPDPFYADNNTQISESYFLNDFIYRGTMKYEPSKKNQAAGKVWLNFDGINWKADVSLNGIALGRIEGAFTDARFDVTGIAHEGGNEIEV